MMRKDDRKSVLGLFRHPGVLVLVLLIGCGGATKSSSDKGVSNLDKEVVKEGKAEPKKTEQATMEMAQTANEQIRTEKTKVENVAQAATKTIEEALVEPQKIKAVRVALTETKTIEEALEIEPQKIKSVQVAQAATKKKAAKSSSAKRSVSRSKLPCDPVMVSGITGECAGTGAPGGFAGEAFQEGLKEHPIALEESLLPKDRFGLIDWADAIKAGNIKPLHDFDPKKPDMPQLDMDVVIFTKSQFQPDVIFPHKIHTMWLTCINCHPSIFPMNAKQANKMMTMPKIAAGQFCGKCHNRVAFPLSDCERCHIKPRNVPPIDPDAARWKIKPIKVPN